MQFRLVVEIFFCQEFHGDRSAELDDILNKFQADQGGEASQTGQQDERNE